MGNGNNREDINNNEYGNIRTTNCIQKREIDTGYNTDTGQENKE